MSEQLPVTEFSLGLELVMEELKDMLIRKNMDYGNSFEEQYKKYGLTSYLIRDDDKTRRLENLVNKDAYVNESILDTVMDKAGYAILMYYQLVKEMKDKEE